MSFLVSCGPIYKDPKAPPRVTNFKEIKVSDQLKSYVREWEEYAENKVTFDVLLVDKYSYKSEESESIWLGVCYQYDYRSPIKVEFIEKVWNVSAEVIRKILIAHELGHCALGMNHNDDYKNIMNSTLDYYHPQLYNWEELKKDYLEVVNKQRDTI